MILRSPVAVDLSRSVDGCEMGFGGGMTLGFAALGRVGQVLLLPGATLPLQW